MAFLLLAMPSITASAAQDEAYGVVTNVLDGDTFDITIEKADSRIVSSVERIRLADVDSPEMDTPGGPASRDFTYAVLMNKRVFLDIDDRSGNGRDPYGRLVCIAYLTGFFGQPLMTPSFNQMLIDSGHAKINNFANNEFSLEESSYDSNSYDESNSDGSRPDKGGLKVQPVEAQPEDNLSRQLESLKSDLLSQLRDALASELDKRADEAVNWLRGQSSVPSLVITEG
jgi:endonuclease YncB( thermonuclease family)